MIQNDLKMIEVNLSYAFPNTLCPQLVFVLLSVKSKFVSEMLQVRPTKINEEVGTFSHCQDKAMELEV